MGPTQMANHPTPHPDAWKLKPKKGEKILEIGAQALLCCQKNKHGIAYEDMEEFHSLRMELVRSMWNAEKLEGALKDLMAAIRFYDSIMGAGKDKAFLVAGNEKHVGRLKKCVTKRAGGSMDVSLLLQQILAYWIT